MVSIINKWLSVFVIKIHNQKNNELERGFRKYS